MSLSESQSSLETAHEILEKELAMMQKFVVVHRSNLRHFPFYKVSSRVCSILLKYFIMYGKSLESRTGRSRSLIVCQELMKKVQILIAKCWIPLRAWAQLGHLSHYCGFISATLSRMYVVSIESLEHLNKLIQLSGVEAHDLVCKKLILSEAQEPCLMPPRETKTSSDFVERSKPHFDQIDPKVAKKMKTKHLTQNAPENLVTKLVKTPMDNIVIQKSSQNKSKVLLVSLKKKK